MSRLLAAWRRVWFEPVPTATLAVLRIAVGVLVFLWTVSLAPDVLTFFGPHGVLPQPTPIGWNLGVLGSIRSSSWVLVVYAALLLASLCLALGYHSRLASVVVFLGVLSFKYRNLYVFNSGDDLVRILALFLALSPCGVALSIDRWKAHRDQFWEFPARAPWALRLIQVQLSVVYASTVWAKVRGTTWNEGTAVSYALRLGDLLRFHVPAGITQSILIVNLFTYGTLAIEASLAILVWNRKARPWVLALGVLLHLSIDASLLVGFFSYAVLVGYLSFIPPEVMAYVVDLGRTRLARSRIGPLRRWAAAGPAGGAPGREPLPLPATP